ncbi:DUF998 domain-containing protein [Frigoribacterium sp. PvP032]|uniref:DUF998 domain-containing protein n=1 Tax=Frigoribacterium sp. PvP032 TaxID=2806589 RepID=UPI001AE6F5D3|nr:DUF998 domain-containing protein [Frigoribacterium sp. PvP032]MBP1189581.1 hypothetical protein [Frigoribacterium sp. PvP032]
MASTVSRTSPSAARPTGGATASGSARSTTSCTTSRTVAAGVGSALTAVALVLIWVARSRVDRPVYVSELGADGEPTAALFEAALLLVVAGGLLVAWAARGLRAGRGMRAAGRLLGAWTVSTSIATASGLFLVASQVPCTAGCPLPVGATFTVQDLVHTTSAVLAFTAACVAMLQASFVAGRRRLRVLSMLSGVSVALIAAAGGLLSLLRVGTDVGGVLELVATTIAIGWLIVLGVSTLGTGSQTGPVRGRSHPAEADRTRASVRAAA